MFDIKEIWILVILPVVHQWLSEDKVLLCARLYIPIIATTISPIFPWSSCSVMLMLPLCLSRGETRSFPLEYGWDCDYGEKKKKVPLYDFQNRTMKVDTTSSQDFWDAHSWNTTTMLWGNITTTQSHHVQVSLPIATVEVPALPDMLKIQITPAFKLPWALGSFQESIQTSWNINNLSLLCLLQIPDPQNLGWNAIVLL